MSEQLRVRLVQRAADLDPSVNRDALASVAGDDADLVVWPEAFSRDFGAPGSDLSPYAEDLDGPFAQALTAAAGQGTAIAGMFERSNDPARPFNTLLVTGATRASYRKIHLYDSFGHRESDVLSAGDPEPVVVDVAGWRVGLMTCYDLRFPELARALADRGAEVIVVPAAWVAGQGKVRHWQMLLAARAIENLAYVVAVGQPGPRYCGHSMVLDPLGEVVVEARESGGEVLDATLSRAVLDRARHLNPSLDNRRMPPVS